VLGWHPAHDAGPVAVDVVGVQERDRRRLVFVGVVVGRVLAVHAREVAGVAVVLDLLLDELLDLGLALVAVLVETESGVGVGEQSLE
jgi:hypothetical protein